MAGFGGEPVKRAVLIMCSFKKLIRGSLFLVGLSALALVGALAQRPTPMLTPVEAEFDFYEDRAFRNAIERPERVLGYEPGESYADYGEVGRLLTSYVESSDRAKLLVTGKTNERRPMHVVAVSSPTNIARLDEIKAINQRLVDGREKLSDRALEKLIKKQPIIVWLSYNIHGDEAAGTEAAMRVLYELLDSADEEVEEWLEQAVVLINPCQNPDGRERFVTWIRAHGIGRPETFAWEKENRWIVHGRVNHYYFDLNRDMIALSQVESRNSGTAFLEWMPQVSADHHGETKEYFFPPAALPINPNLPGEATERWMETFGRGLAAAFDERNWMYYVRDQFDLFYPGYWDSWPALQGATGMTFETTAGGEKGVNLRRDDGTVTTLRTAIAKHFTSSLATIRTAVGNRKNRLRDFREFFVSAVASGRDGDLQQVFLTDRNPERRARLGTALRRSGIEVRELIREVEVEVESYLKEGEPTSRSFPKGTWLVDLAQPRGRLAKALLERSSAVDEAFLQRQLDKNARNAERGENVPEDGLEFYDITAWNLPLMYGVEAFAAANAAAVRSELLEVIPVVRTVPTPERAQSAYVLPVGRDSGQQVVFDLLSEGYRVSASARPFDVDGTSFQRGSFVVRIERNPVELHERIVELAVARGAEVVAVDTAFSGSGISGIGSAEVYALEAPKILVATGDGVSSTSYGALKFLFEQTFEIDYVPVAVSRLKNVDLRGFNVVVLPSGSVSKLKRELGAGGESALKAWVEAGGTLICLGGATELLVEGDESWTSVAQVGSDNEEESEQDEEEEVLGVPGALLRATIDQDHFLSFGYAEAEMPFLVDTDVFLTASDTGTNVVTFAEQDLWLSGVTWPGNSEELIAGAAAVIDEPLGEGHVVLFTDEPGYRALWYGTTRILLNAILYGPALSGEAGSYQP